jgi:hypothetical protein
VDLYSVIAGAVSWLYPWRSLRDLGIVWCGVALAPIAFMMPLWVFSLFLNLLHTISGGLALASVMIQEANWSKFNFYSGMCLCRRQKNTCDANSDSGKP